MAGFTVLVTAMHLADEAQRMLADAGARLLFMPDPIDEGSLIERLASTPVDAIILRGSRPITARVMAAGPTLRIIAKNGAGVDSVDLAEATRRGIVVAVASSANADAVAEMTLSIMLSLVRDVVRLDRKVRRGEWETTAYQGRDLRGSVVGIVGYGSIGQRAARLAAALGTRVLVHRLSGVADDFEVDADFDRFLSRVDVLSLHCPLTERTRGLIGERELSLMKPGALIVNTARGAVIDEPALVAALRSGRLGGAGLDTFVHEPLGPDHPLLALDNVILTPHIAGVTRDAAVRVATITAKNVIDVMQGRDVAASNLVRLSGRS